MNADCLKEEQREFHTLMARKAHTLFTQLVGKTRSRSVMAEAVGKIDRLN